MKRQSSIEWFFEQLEFNESVSRYELLEQSKELHRQEILLTHIHNRCSQDKTYECTIKAIENAEQYYNDNFKSE